MNALPRPPQTPLPRRRVSSRRQQLQRQQFQQSRQEARQQSRPAPGQQAIAAEATTKLFANALLSVIAVVALFKLLPYNLSQQKSLDDLQSKVVEVEKRVDVLQSDFNHHFDPKQARLVMQEESTRVDPGQRQIVWLKPQVAPQPAPRPDKSQPRQQREAAQAAYVEPDASQAVQ
jgi:hypothetical protein